MKPPPIPPHAADGTTTHYGPDTSRSPRRPLRCQVAMALAGKSSFRGAIESLLHRRLLFVALLTLVPSLIFFVRNRIDTNLPEPLSRMGLCFHGSISLVSAA